MTVAVRYRPAATVGTAVIYPLRIGVLGLNGGNTYRQVMVSLSPTPGDFSMPEGDCKFISVGQTAPVRIGPEHCAIDTSERFYYLNIRALEECTDLGCIFKVSNGAWLELE